MIKTDIDILCRVVERSIRKVLNEIEAERHNRMQDLSRYEDNEIIERIYSALHSSIYNTRTIIGKRLYVGLTDNIYSNLRYHNITEYLYCCRISNYRQGIRIMQELATSIGIFTGVMDSQPNPEFVSDYTILYIAKRDTPGFRD